MRDGAGMEVDAFLDAAPDAVFRSLLEAAPDAMLCVDADGRIVVANAEAERLFGYPRDELIGSTVEMLVPDAARPAHPRRRAEYARDPRTRPMGAGMQLAGRRKDGSEFPAEISLSAMKTEHGVVVSAAVRDVSDRLRDQAEHERLRAEAERERLEVRLQQSQRLESLGQLAGGVAHDFNNLLGVILNYAAFVNEELTDADRAADSERWAPVREDVAQISRAAERAALLTRQLLSFARREVVRPRVVDLNEAITEVEQLLVRSLGEHVELATNLAPGVWPVLVDPGKFEQVLVNLAVNARDAMPDGGKLTIDTQNIVADDAFTARRPGLAEGRYVRVRVSDTGAGMPPEVRQRAFEPFYTTKDAGEGTGLGLATVYGIVHQADGEVQIYSEPGLGTTINVLLPATDDAPEAEESAIAEVARGRGEEVVLVVEDEEPLRAVTGRVLERNGYTVLSAANGPEALAVADATDRIDLLLTDVVMPLMLGKELAERLVAARPGLRVVFMSGYAQPVLTTSGGLNPDIHLIEKPFAGEMLLAKVREVLDAPAGTASSA